MGLLSKGKPLSWEETKQHADHVRQHGIIQFINQYNKHKDRDNDPFYWGDEIEYMLVKFDDERKTAKLYIDAEKVLTKLQQRRISEVDTTAWGPEYAAYIVEGTPGKPYQGIINNLNMVESNMKLRKLELQQVLPSDIVVINMTVFPRLGVDDFTDPPSEPTPDSGASLSLFCSGDVINQFHPRFMNLTRNIRQRRGKKVDIQVPIYKDRKTFKPVKEDTNVCSSDCDSAKTANPDSIYMDCMIFGMGCPCLQVTFQASNMTQARLLYDQLVPICPLMLALSAAASVFRGHLSDNDVRWNVIAQSVDDRTDEERGIKDLFDGKFRIAKSQFGSVSSYLMPQFEVLNDIELVFDQNVFEQLQKAGVDDALARHIAHLFTRDTVSLFEEKIEQNDEEETDHFENIQSTNWQTMRFKIPPTNSNIGWRVEFRPMEVRKRALKLLEEGVTSKKMNVMLKETDVSNKQLSSFIQYRKKKEKNSEKKEKNSVTEHAEKRLIEYSDSSEEESSEENLLGIPEDHRPCPPVYSTFSFRPINPTM